MKNLIVMMLFVLLLASLAPALTAQSVPAWQPNTAYSVGSLVTFNGVTYSCIQAHTSEVGWEPPNVPALWQPVNPKGGASCSAAPGAPTGLASSGITSTGLTLNWTAPAIPANCTLGNYTIFQNGSSIGTTTGMNFSVTGLSPSTTYTFTVTASDAAGASGQSATISVSTSAANSGGGGSGCAPAWSSTAVYTGGMTASVNGINYKANWWTQRQNPTTNNGGAGSGQPWTIIGPCAACSAIPSAPAGLTASGTTGFSTVLNWTASTVPSNCSITGYTVFENGASIGTAIGTSFIVTGLSPQTKYSFTVAANDSAGSSAPSSAISVTTNTTPVTGGGSKLFAPYIDMSLTPDEQLLTIQQQSGIKVFTLAFIVSSGGCTPGWGGIGAITNDMLPNGTTISSLVQGVRAAGGDVIISFGGALGSELALTCSDAASLQAAYQSVINKYQVKMLDFDIEGGAVSDQASITRRDQALVGLKAANPSLIISYTLPVLPTGLVSTGVNILNSVKADGLKLDVVNVMAMDYGSANDNGGQMGLDATLAASNTEAQIQAAGLTATVGVTPMIGVNDTNTEIFQLSDAQTLLNFANSHSYITRIAMWSVARDNGSCAGAGFASPTCSSITQSLYQFSSIFNAFQ